MVLRNIVIIDEEKCNGCGDCVNACAEGAIEIIDGKAKLVSEVYCDGLGACLGHCPQDAITVQQREAAEFDEEATKTHLTEKKNSSRESDSACTGMVPQNLRQRSKPSESVAGPIQSQLSHWPVQLKLVSPAASYFANADLLLVADCVPFVMGDFHDKFLKNHSIAIGCPKLDEPEYYIEKLAEILKTNKLNSLTVIHMEVPCCSGLTDIAKKAIAESGVAISFEDITIDLRGNVIGTKTINK